MRQSIKIKVLTSATTLTDFVIPFTITNGMKISDLKVFCKNEIKTLPPTAEFEEKMYCGYKEIKDDTLVPNSSCLEYNLIIKKY